MCSLSLSLSQNTLLFCTYPSSCNAFRKKGGHHPHFLIMLPEPRQIIFVFIFTRPGLLALHTAPGFAEALQHHHIVPELICPFMRVPWGLLRTFLNISSVGHVKPGLMSIEDLLWMKSSLLNQFLQLCQKCLSGNFYIFWSKPIPEST